MSRIYTHELTEKHWVDVHYRYEPGDPWDLEEKILESHEE